MYKRQLLFFKARLNLTNRNSGNVFDSFSLRCKMWFTMVMRFVLRYIVKVVSINNFQIKLSVLFRLSKSIELISSPY